MVMVTAPTIMVDTMADIMVDTMVDTMETTTGTTITITAVQNNTRHVVVAMAEHP
jgi:hypothetical protein